MGSIRHFASLLVYKSYHVMDLQRADAPVFGLLLVIGVHIAIVDIINVFVLTVVSLREGWQWTVLA